jgi:SAM-dependent methyltransferase
MQKTRLNLGAGNLIEDPTKWINHDRMKHRPEIDAVWDLNQLPWPWRTGSMEQITAKAVFEHIDIDLLKAIDECWRILRPGGILYVKLPNAEDYIGCWGDPTHRRPFTLSFTSIFDYKSKNTGNNFYTTRKWKIRKKGGTGKQNSQGIWSSIFAEMEKVR